MAMANETSFTPGPWAKQGEYGGLIMAADGTNVAVVLNLILATKKQHPVPCEAGTVRANADLIAAAPELYEALRALVEKHGGLGCSPEVRRAMEVLAKVEGK